MPQPLSSDPHDALRKEWAETPAELTYRYVVSFERFQAAHAAARNRFNRAGRWQRAIAFFGRDVLRLIVGAAVVAILAWVSLQGALVASRLLGSAGAAEVSPLIPVGTFVSIFLLLFIAFRLAVPRLVTLMAYRTYCEYFRGTEFTVEAANSLLSFGDRSATVIRRWSAIEEAREFEGGLWLFVKRPTARAKQVGILISAESLPGSCSWERLRAYVQGRAP